MKIIAADLHYFPNLEFFAALDGVDEIVFFPKDLYQRQSYFNRTQIRLANKIETLSVPIEGRRPKIPLDQIKISQTVGWEKVHLRGIQSAYGKAPFYEYYFPYFEQVFSKGYVSLWDLNWDIMTICLKLLRSTVKMRVSSEVDNNTITKDIRGLLRPSSHFSDRNIYETSPYFQLFGLDFEPNLSVLDLLFCEGTAAASIIRQSVKKSLNNS